MSNGERGSILPTAPASPSEAGPAHEARDTTQRANSQLIVELQQIRSEFSGPIPPPVLLAGYDKVLPGLADRIVKMAEYQQQSHLSMQAKNLESDISDRKAARSEARLGQIFGLLIGIVALGTAAYMATHGAQIPGGVIGSTGIGGLVYAFIKGRQHELERPATHPAQSGQTKAGKSGKRRQR
jgi:uncharacterized membrane protein